MKNLYQRKRPLPGAEKRRSAFSQEERQRLAYELAADSIVLLKNTEKILPLKRGEKLAVFGRSQIDTVIGGFGSGSSGDSAGVRKILDELVRAGLSPVEELAGFYREKVGAEVVVNPFAEIFEKGATDLVNSGIIYEIFGKYQPAKEEYEIPGQLMQSARRETDTALLVIGRSSGGEECDRHVPEDYELTASEKALAQAVCTGFSKVIVILNTNGVVDTGWVEAYPSVSAVLFMGCPGQEGSAALADILVGNKTPSGKLCSTFAKAYDDYPTAQTFSWDKEHPETIKEYKNYGLDAAANGSTGFAKSPVTLYREGIYLGYRYFDTFQKAPAYPFGFGLSYADFALTDASAAKAGDCLSVQVTVKNTSSTFAGREVAQVYVSAPDGKLEKPAQELRAFCKTRLLQPGETETLHMEIPFREMASYDEETASYILEPGVYAVRLGDSSRNTDVIGAFEVTELIRCAACENRLSVQKANEGKIDWLSKKTAGQSTEALPAPLFALTQADVPTETVKAAPTAEQPDNAAGGTLFTLEDVADGKVAMERFLEQMTVEELATLAVGYGPGLPFGGLGSEAPPCLSYGDGTPIAVSSHKTGTNGYISPSLPKYKIPSIYYKDGPAWVGGVSWPTGMLLACSFDPELLYQFGSCCGFEAEELGVNSWLAPALNLHRNPIGGRNFEYFSEDPLLAGVCGTAICRGAEENNNVTACPKHFALNEQETYRRGSGRFSFDAVDSIVTERAARELYLKPFEMVVKGSHAATLMSSFNKINGTFAAGNADLCTHILREEWGYEGVVVTDWGDMDQVVDGADAVAAGNDVIMPGGPPVAAQILKGFEEGRVTRGQLIAAAANLLRTVLRCTPPLE